MEKITHTDRFYLKMALQEAKKALLIDEVPVGAVLVMDGKIIARAYNKKEKKLDITAHAEIEVLKKAAKKLNTWHLDDATLYVTLEPCPMCASAIMQAHVSKIVYGSIDPSGGAIESTIKLYEFKGFNSYPQTCYIKTLPECGKIISDYFKNKR